MTRPQAHRQGDRDIELVILLVAIAVVLVTLVLWGVPGGLPG